MPKHHTRLTDTEARKIAAPLTPYALHWCPRTPGLGLRVTAAGARAWIVERRVDGKTTRRTLGPASGRGAISAEAARNLLLMVSSELQQGIDRLEVKRERHAAEKVEGVTFAAALEDYVKNKRRGKDGLPLKERTKADYLAMIDPAGMLKSGAPTLAGELFDIAKTPLHRIDADTIRAVHKSLADRGERRQTYGMQVLRAVLRHHGVTIEGNPLSSTTAGKDRVSLAPSRGNPSPIPPEALGAWWRAATSVLTPSADLLRFALLTGARPGEVSGLTVGAVDIRGARATMFDTKNRTDHVVLLSRQALEIVERAVAGKKDVDAVFTPHRSEKTKPKKGALLGIGDAGKTLTTINKLAGIRNLSQNKLRHTFASIAAELVPAFALKRMVNHAAGGDVTAGHYVQTSEKALRAAWQTVADHIETAD